MKASISIQQVINGSAVPAARLEVELVLAPGFVEASDLERKWIELQGIVAMEAWLMNWRASHGGGR